MLHVGIDFGTTNTTIAFFESGQEDKTKPQTYKNTNNNTDYIPSYVAIDTKSNDQSYEIGSSAKSKEGDSDYQVFNRFKMLLSEDDQALIQRYGLYNHQTHTPKEISKKYLKELMNQFTKNYNKKISDIKKLVITVPEIWTASDPKYYAKGKQSQQRIYEICSEIGLPKPKLVSEPAGAAAYFSEEYHKQHHKYFKGHVLVCDCGGGTIDFSLLKIERKPNEKNKNYETDITPVAREGVGHNKNSQLGCAGVAFDEAMIDYLSQKASTKPEQKAFIDQYRKVILNDFEDKKITNTETIDKYYKNYCQDIESDRKVFSLSTYAGEIPVRVSELDQVFKQTIQPALIDTLEKLKKSCENNQVDYDANKGDVFKILMVGGFSRFALVQRTIKEFFGSDFYDDADDSRFNHAVPNSEIHLAIAYGASLYAKNITHLKSIVPLDILFKFPNRNYLLVKNKDVTTNYQIPNYEDAPKMRLSLPKPNSTKSIDLVLIRENYPEFPVKVSHIQESFPNPTDTHSYALAITIDENELYYLHVKEYDPISKKIFGNEKITPLGDILIHATALVPIEN